MSTWKVVEKSRTGTTQYLKIQYSPETTPFSESEKYNIEGVYMAGTAIVNDSGGTVTVYGTIDKVNYFTMDAKSISGAGYHSFNWTTPINGFYVKSTSNSLSGVEVIFVA